MRVTTYRIRFEVVRLSELWRYSNADPSLYKNTTQTVPNSEIPDEHWYPVTGHESEDPWTQLANLRKWDAEDTGFVRNVRLEQLATEPVWIEVPADSLPGGSS